MNKDEFMSTDNVKVSAILPVYNVAKSWTMQLVLRMKSSNKSLVTLILLYLVISFVGASILLNVEGLTLVVFMTLLTSNDNKQER